LEKDMKIDQLETVQLGGVPQRIRIRSNDTANPVLLLMQQGPGMPIINEVRRFERLLRLEDAFTVVYWDQRGTGLSALPLRKRSQGFEISPRHMVDDAIALLALLRDRFGRAFIAGFSFGATYAAQAAVLRPDLVAAVVATGMDIDIPLAETSAYDFALTTARERGSRRAVGQLEAIGPPPHLDVKRFQARGRWVTNFGGVQIGASFATFMRDLLSSLVRSPDYSVTDIIRTVRGVGASLAALLPQLADTDLVATMPRLEVPIVLVQGRLDQVAPGAAAQRFHDALTAPGKELVWFEKSAHMPHLDEPDKFRGVLMNVRARHHGSGVPAP
jgi:pimeloyl-ACP methyl ester carboxylesterase